MTLRVVELYNSFQGEGPNTGRHTTFLRFAGCNFKCPGWACDTQHAIDPAIFSKSQKLMTADDVLTALRDIGAQNVCFTGGEPFLQNDADLTYLCRKLKAEGIKTEVFTNGSLDWNDKEFVDEVETIVLDWKLPGSGEEPDRSVVIDNIRCLSSVDAVKFTVADSFDFIEAQERYLKVIKDLPNGSRPQVWCGPVWGKLEAEELANWILMTGLPWYLNIQSHKYIFGADTQGV